MHEMMKNKYATMQILKRKINNN